MGMYYHIEVKNNEDLNFVDFPYPLSYFFDQIGGYEEKSIVTQIEKILNIDLSVFQKTYYEMDFDEDFEINENEIDPDDFWISIDELLDKLVEFNNKMNEDINYFSKVIFNPKDDRNVYSDFNFDFDKITKYQEENPLTLYPFNNGIVTEKILLESVNKLYETLIELKAKGEEQIRLIYG